MSTSQGEPGLVLGVSGARPSGRRAVGPGGRYVLDALLGRGGMADVYRAHDQILGRDVAVKLLRDRAPDPADRARFVSEAQTLARLNHPNLVTILDAGISDEHPFLVLELVVGSSLSVALAHAGQGLPPERVASIGAQIAAGLAHCHAAGIVHRDVKPGNILLGAGDRALLTDFGISRLLDGSAHDTRTGFTIGTAGYLAPEQVYGDEITPAVDLYALGLVLLEACTGRREYTGTPVEAAIARLHRSPRVPADVPPALAGILAALTRTDPALRPDAVATARALGSGTPPTSALDGSAPRAATTVHESPTGLTPTPGPSAATGPLDLSPPMRRPARFADAAVLAHAGNGASASSAAAPPTEQRRRGPVFALAGWLVAAVAAVTLALSLNGRSPDPAGPPTGSTPEPEKPAPARTTPSRQATPAPEVAAPPAAPLASADSKPRSASRRGSTTPRTSVPAPAQRKAQSNTNAGKPAKSAGGPSQGKGGHGGKGK